MVVFEFPELETERLRLRKMTVADAEAVFELFSDADVTKDMGIAPFSDVRQAVELIDFMNDLFRERKAFRWGIIKKDDNAVIGTCGFNGWEMNRGARGEIAYDLGKPYWRRGFMTEALRTVIPFGFETMGFYRIEAFTNVDAFPSMKLLRRLGFREDGLLRGYALSRGKYVDQRCFSLLRDEWIV
ncbi:GNAT family N-acetyltransferase [Paenibacillus antri]|uniref:GNAT family N-acetyltransferase n=1 Tax=Paenibacillus antri TaxID=2582848 RepID=A0A5R9GA30_9BACL|nr:GNAT family protein [Paenibacillus antri]TLS53302.1 GNAT family N-acetyltransferase [Paenibacillus antri]